MSTSLGLGIDRFREDRFGDANTVQGRFKVEATDGRSTVLVPYVAYTGTGDFDRNFRHTDDVLHDVAVGATSGIGFEPSGEVIDFRNSTGLNQSSLSVDLRFGRRWSDQAALQNAFLLSTAEYAYNLRTNLYVAAGPSLRLRWYDNYYGRFRQDVRAGAILRVAWKPDWLVALLPRSELSFGLGYFRNHSSVASMSYSQWEFGPSLEVGQKF